MPIRPRTRRSGQDLQFVVARSGFRWNVVGNLRTGTRVPIYGWSIRLAIGPDGSRSLSYTMKVAEGQGPAPTVVTTPSGVQCQTGAVGEGGGDPAAYGVSPFPSAIGGKTLRVVIRSLTPTSRTGTTWQAYAELKGGTRYALGSPGVPATGEAHVSATVRSSTEDWTVFGTCPAVRVETVYGAPTFRRADGTAKLGQRSGFPATTCADSRITPSGTGWHHRLGK